MAAKLTRLVHKIVTTAYSGSSRAGWPVRKLLDTPSHYKKYHENDEAEETSRKRESKSRYHVNDEVRNSKSRTQKYHLIKRKIYLENRMRQNISNYGRWENKVPRNWGRFARTDHVTKMKQQSFLGVSWKCKEYFALLHSGLKTWSHFDQRQNLPSVSP
jgi:hypothetical protein